MVRGYLRKTLMQVSMSDLLSLLKVNLVAVKLICLIKAVRGLIKICVQEHWDSHHCNAVWIEFTEMLNAFNICFARRLQ